MRTEAEIREALEALKAFPRKNDDMLVVVCALEWTLGMENGLGLESLLAAHILRQKIVEKGDHFAA